ncbi:N-acetylglucosamine-6-sulfatase-like [Dysidea avara]|uniref:N-acetylglucosamine-6-sulfatase-like n=1 Tax=Dysidea avara TaxID=196820 RepID=UPI00333300F9
MWITGVVCVSILFNVVYSSKPNIVYILTDDQDIKLNSLDVQPKVKSMLIDEGLFFDNAFVTTPVCCPSRSSILTGKYTHNHHTYENGVKRGCNAASWRQLNEKKTVGYYMSMAGYKTGLFGKYLNNYALPQSGMNVNHIPPGWSKWFGLVGNSKFYHYSVSNDGVEEKHGNDYEKDYFTDVIKREAVQFIKNSTQENKPFFVYIGTPAPHRPATPAPQYNQTFDNHPAPRTPSYNYNSTDKHWIISKGTPPMSDATKMIVDTLYQDRLETLLSVDDLVGEVVTTLQTAGVLDNTYIFYNSDHGYHLGQFNQQGEKRQPYDEDIRVPLIVRGPGINSGKKTDRIALNIDITPTFLDLAGFKVPEDIDGVSLKPVLLNTTDLWRDDFMIEYYGEGSSPSGCMGVIHPPPGQQVFLHDCHNNTFIAVRTINEKYNNIYSEFYSTDDAPIAVGNTYFQEYYDLKTDYWELKNTYNSADVEMIKQLKERANKLYHCQGQSCH